jgi:two-component system, cell cycle response regulator
MDASILLIGNSQFCDALLTLIPTIDGLAVEHVADPFEAMPLILAQQPDLLLIQASQTHSPELCQQVKSQTCLAWIYCMVVDDQAQTLDLAHRLDLHTAILEAGADVVLALPSSGSAVGPEIDPEIGPETSSEIGPLARLFQAQLQTGLRQIRTHRELMRTNDVLSAIALSDPLTSLNNRRAFEWELPRQIQNARSRAVPISLMMLDVDFFKAINDTYGHLTGDQVLKFLAARLQHNLRIYDTPFRYGGEEFVIILSNTDQVEALQIADRLCQLISEQPFSIDDTLDLTVTISAGTATLRPEDDAKGMALLHRADQRLLQAKAQGRNRVVGCMALETQPD